MFQDVREFVSLRRPNRLEQISSKIRDEAIAAGTESSSSAVTHSPVVTTKKNKSDSIEA